MAVGDIYRTSWGYDQTNVEFYEVVRETEKSVWVRPIAARTHPETLRLHPKPGEYLVERGFGTRSWNDTVFDEKTGTFVPNTEYQRDLDRGYSEKVCRKRSGYQGSSVIALDTSGYIRHGYLYDMDADRGSYDTIAAGLPGH